MTKRIPTKSITITAEANRECSVVPLSSIVCIENSQIKSLCLPREISIIGLPHITHVTLLSPMVLFTIISESCPDPAVYSPILFTLSVSFSQTEIPGFLRTCKPVRKYPLINYKSDHIFVAKNEDIFDVMR